MELFEKYESEVRSYCRHFPEKFTKAKGAFIWNNQGRRYIDFFAGAGALNYGHNNPYMQQKLLEYISNDGITHSLDMYTEAKEAFISKFVTDILLPRGLDYKIMFCGSTGTNAIESALKLVRKYTGRHTVFSFQGSFHGMSLGSLSITSSRSARAGAGVPLANSVFVPYPSNENDSFDTINYIENLILDDHSGVDIPAAIFLETVQAEGGVNVAPVKWLQRLRALCDRYEILLVVDDIQIGCGRTGTFFSFEEAAIIPDIVILSKSISGYGLPMSIMLMKRNLDIWNPGEHNGTFRGNQLAFVTATAGIELFNSPETQHAVMQNSELVNDFLEKEICPIHPGLKVRGKGLIWGIDFSNIDHMKAQDVAAKCFEDGLIIECAGRGESVLKLLPPLVTDTEALLTGLEIIQKAIEQKIYG